MMTISTALRDAMLGQIISALTGGAQEPRLRILNIAKPATPETAITPFDVLAEFVFDSPAATLTDGLITFAVVPDTDALASGTPLSARLEDGDSNGLLDVDVITSGTPTGGQLLVDISDPLVEGQPISLSSLTLGF
jgi:hypothetical protein